MTELSIDFESFCELPLKKVGSSRYWRHESAEPILLGWAIDDYPAQVVRLAEGEKMPKALVEALKDPHVVKHAHNASFEIQGFEHGMGMPIPIKEWRCTMVQAYSLSFPGSLDIVGKLLGIEEEKQKLAIGKKLIKRFCTPHKPTKKEPWTRCNHLTNPEEWELFVEYCKMDVESERAIRKKMSRWELPIEFWREWWLDQRINRAGIPVNMRVVRNAIKVAKEVTDSRIARMREITSCKNPNSGKQLLPWLKAQGYVYDDLKKVNVRNAFERATPGSDLRTVLALRMEASKTSVKKYNALANTADSDGVVRNCFQFMGAPRTGRDGGRIYQPQNLAKPPKYLEGLEDELVRHLEVFDAEQIEMLYDKPMDVLSTCVRPVVQAPPGMVFIDADLSAIENRVIGWLAGDEKILDVFRHNRDPYLDFATYMYQRPYDELYAEYKAGDKSKRNDCKPATLGCGFMLSAGAEKLNKKTGEMEADGLLGYAKNMGVKLAPETAQKAVKVFRSTFTGVVDLWYDLDRAMRRTIISGDTTRVGFIKFDKSGPFVRMHLPSGRCLHYFRPRIKDHRTPWGAIRPTIMYEGLNDKKKWAVLTTHPGKITENCLGGDTVVVTSNGNKKLVNITTDDLLWDGVEWVPHDGIIDQGIRPVIDLDGVTVTPDHRVLCHGGVWKNAETVKDGEATSAFAEHFGRDFRGAHSAALLGKQRETLGLGDRLQLRKVDSTGGLRVSEEKAEILRLQAIRNDRTGQQDPRDDETSGLCGLAFYAGTLPESKTSGLVELRRTRHKGLRRLADLVSMLLVRYGANVSTWRGPRSSGQQPGLLSAKLPMGNSQGQLAQQTYFGSNGHAVGPDHYSRSSGAIWHQLHYAKLQAEGRGPSESNVRCAGRNEQVFDLVNAGPRTRFTVLDREGKPFIVHNCVQAVARDILFHGAMLAYRRRREDIRLRVHDQLAALVPAEGAEERLQLLIEDMTTVPSWAPGLILGAAGAVTRVFKKD